MTLRPRRRAVVLAAPPSAPRLDPVVAALYVVTILGMAAVSYVVYFLLVIAPSV